MVDFPNYTSQDTLHQSARSAVYRAVHTKNGRPVVLKVLQDQFPTPDKIKRFQTEYEMAAELSIDGVPQYVDIFEHQNRPVIVMEDFGGISLARSMKDLPQIDRALDIFIDIARILGQIHQAGITHKDINPSNILINPKDDTVKIIDFGISSRLSREVTAENNPNKLEGTLTYIAPEQTGRMNRTVDYRTDFYSLGVTMYELLTGYRPFVSRDPMELIHSHIAKQPPAPHKYRLELPSILSKIILKLMSKNAEERYQSAVGLIHDLEECRQQWEDTGQITPFTLGEKDVSDRFQIPEKLYGRETDLHRLMQTFDTIRNGDRAVVMVSGQAGIGKSSLIREVNKPIVKQRGYFVSGKFDQFQRNVPYASLSQALRGLVRQLLSAKDSELKAWKQRIRQLLGPNGRLITDVIPELELIVGEQPEPPLLNPAEAQNRFSILFADFIRLFAQAEHPLVIFLDDLQWADAATLNLLTDLMGSNSTQYLLLIGAYRDDEIPASHPLHTFVERMGKQQTAVEQLHLGPLTVDDLTHLLIDTLSCAEEDARPLSELIHQKTGGNPFFIAQFLQSFYEAKLLNFNMTTRRWEWKIKDVRRRKITDNVVSLLTDKLSTLPAETQELLQIAACIGNRFELSILAVVAQQTRTETAERLWPALRESLIRPIGDAYKFVQDADQSDVQYQFQHDRVQQAAYNLISADDRKSVHLRIGRLIYENTTAEERQESPFELVNQYNQGLSLLTDDAEKHRLAQLNLTAGQKAKSSIAYEPAYTYLKAARTLLPPDAWTAVYGMAYEIYTQLAEVAYLTSRFDEATDTFENAFENAQTNIEKASICNQRVSLYTTQGQYADAIDVGIIGLNLLGMNLPDHRQEIDVMPEIVQVAEVRGDREISSLIDDPFTDREDIMLASLLLARISASAYFLDQMLLTVILLRLAYLSLKYGNSKYSAYSYATYGILLTIALGDPDAGFEFGKLAFAMDDRFGNYSLRHRTHHAFGTFISHHHIHAAESIEYLHRGFEYGRENGDLIYAGYCGNVAIYYMALIDTPLNELEQKAKKYLDFVEQAQDQETADNIIVSIQMARALQGQTVAPTQFHMEEGYDEDAHVEQMKNSPMKLQINWYYILKMRTYYMFGEYERALAMGEASEQLIPFSNGLLQVPEHELFYALTLAALYPTADKETQSAYWDKMETLRDSLKSRAERCAENFTHKYLFVSAEMARINDDLSTAGELYDQAIESAAEHRYVQNAALGNERAASLYIERGREKLARIYILEARQGYARWGAVAKINQLEEQYADVFAAFNIGRGQAGWGSTLTIGPGTFTSTTSSTSSTGSGAFLDTLSIIKASQALSKEIRVDALLNKLMAIVIENAGAERGLLVLRNDGEWQVEAEGHADHLDDINVRLGRPLNQATETLTLSIVNYVIRTKEAVVIDDAQNDARFNQAPYIQNNQVSSILCQPLLNRNQLTGLVYLENNLTTQAFTASRQHTLRLISSQISISIENATLYDNLRDATDQLREYSANLESMVEERTRELQETVAELSAFSHTVAHDLKTPLGAVIGYGEIVSEDLADGNPRDLSQLFDMTKRIVTSGEQMREIIDSLLLLARVRDDVVMLDALDMGYVVDGALGRYEFTISKRADEVEIVYPDQPWPTVVGQAGWVREVWANYIGNALKYGGETPRIELGFDQKAAEDQYRFWVKDSGPGLSKEAQQKLFIPFTQLQRVNDSHGLGLSIVERIIRRLGGTVGVESEPGEGARFYFTLPAYDGRDY